MRLSLRCALFAALALTACTDPVDKAAKKRIFSPEDPPQVVASAQERLPAEAAAEDARVARRILEMGAAEATERLGPHEYQANVTFEWTGGGASTQLSEKRSLAAGAGGVSGDFDARLQNSRDQGLEVLRVGGQVFARDLYGKFRQRKRDRGMAERTREDVYGTVREFASIFDHRLKLTPGGEVTYEGRKAYRYEVGLAPAPEGPEASAQRLPAPQFARAGRDETTRRREAFFARRHPRALSGEVLVDADASVLLKARLDGKLDVPGQGASAPSALLHMSVDSAVKHVGQAPALKAPADFLPDQDKPSGIADALDRFGIPRGGHADGGVDTELPDEEP